MVSYRNKQLLSTCSCSVYNIMGKVLCVILFLGQIMQLSSPAVATCNVWGVTMLELTLTRRLAGGQGMVFINAI